MYKPDHFPRVRRVAVDYTKGPDPVYRLEAIGSFPAAGEEGWGECVDYVRGIVGSNALVVNSDSDFLIAPCSPDDIMSGNAPAYTALMEGLHLKNRFAVVELHFIRNRPSHLLLALLSTHAKVADLKEELGKLQGADNVQEEVKGEWTFLTVSFGGKVGMKNARKKLDGTSLKGEYILLYRPS